MTVGEFKTKLELIMRDSTNLTNKNVLIDVYNGKIGHLCFAQFDEYYQLFITNYKIVIVDGRGMFVEKLTAIQNLLNDVKEKQDEIPY